jgi:hypothetical protein
MALRRQKHSAALAYAHRKIRDREVMLDDIQTMMAEVEGRAHLGQNKPDEAMWLMLDDLVWKLVEQIGVTRGIVTKVLKKNKNSDENEAWAQHKSMEQTRRFCGLAVIGARR